MRIYDDTHDRTIQNVILLLTKDEMSHLAGACEGLLEAPPHEHTHVNDASYEHEITLQIIPDDRSFLHGRMIEV